MDGPTFVSPVPLTHPNLAFHTSWRDPATGVWIVPVIDGVTTEFSSIPGVTVLSNVGAINSELALLKPRKFTIVSDALLAEAIRQKGLSFDMFSIPSSFSSLFLCLLFQSQFPWIRVEVDTAITIAAMDAYILTLK